MHAFGQWPSSPLEWRLLQVPKHLSMWLGCLLHGPCRHADGGCLALQERLYSWLGGLRASDICGGIIHKLSEGGLASQQRMKLEALRVSGLFSACAQCMACCCCTMGLLHTSQRIKLEAS